MRLEKSILVALALGVTLSGCATSPVDFAAGIVLPHLGGSSDGVHPDEWQRAVVTASGEAVSPATYSGAEPLVVLWHSPFSLKGNTEVAWAGIERMCSSPIPPTNWHALPIRDSNRAEAELWRVVERTPTQLSKAEGRQISAIYAASLLSHVRLGVDETIRWLLYLPRGGSYVMAQEWRGVSMSEAVSVRPCTLRWVPVPLPVFFEATSGGVRKNANGQPDVLDEIERAVELTRPSSGALEQVTAALGLMDNPEFDLIILHQVALNVELGRRLPYGVSPDVVQWIRIDRVARKWRDPREREELCALGRERRLFSPRLSLWNGDATIPLQLQSMCS